MGNYKGQCESEEYVGTGIWEDLARLRADRAALLEALEPFAEYANAVDEYQSGGRYDDDDPCDGSVFRSCCVPTVGELRRARSIRDRVKGGKG